MSRISPVRIDTTLLVLEHARDDESFTQEEQAVLNQAHSLIDNWERDSQ